VTGILIGWKGAGDVFHERIDERVERVKAFVAAHTIDPRYRNHGSDDSEEVMIHSCLQRTSSTAATNPNLMTHCLLCEIKLLL
jgi:hypothetical protein